MKQSSKSERDAPTLGDPDECGYCGGSEFLVYEADVGDVVAIECVDCGEVFVF